jgi:hypothetical protein
MKRYVLTFLAVCCSGVVTWAQPQCVPSRAALMTGRSPGAIQMTRYSAPLSEEY